jgi:large subunit ribosomal protein L29
MRADKVRDLDSTELQSQLREMVEQIYRLRFQLLMGQSDGLKKYRGLRKDRARVLSVLRERELAAEAAKG